MLYLLVSLCLLLVLWRWSQKQGASEPPVAPGWLPIVGHGYYILFADGVDMFNAVKKASTISKEMGGVIRLYLGPRLFYFVTDPEDCVTVSSVSVQKHYVYNFLRPIFGNGILTADVATWKKHSRLLNPAFNQQVLDGFIGIFNAQAQSLVDMFARKVGKQFDHESYLRINSLETICATSFGVKADQYRGLQKQYLPLLEEMLHICNVRIQTFWLHNDFIFNLTSLKTKQDEVVSRVHKFSNEIIQIKKSHIKSTFFLENATGNKSSIDKLKPFLDLILELAKDNPSLTDDQIRSDTITVISAGHDTSASGLTFALTLLGSHPEVQRKAYQEIIDVLGDTERAVDKEDLSKLLYIEAIAKESLRLYPSGPIILRQLDKDIKLRHCTLKAGNGCVLSLYGTHRHPIWGPDVEEFRPERWLDKDTLPDPKYFASFGLGRRFCMGKQYAMMSMKIVLAHVMRKYIISSDVSKMVVKMDTMIRPVEGFYISLENRQSL